MNFENEVDTHTNIKMQACTTTYRGNKNGVQDASHITLIYNCTEKESPHDIVPFTTPMTLKSRLLSVSL